MMKFSRFVRRFINDTEESLKESFRDLQSEKLFVNIEGITNISTRLTTVCNSLFDKLYNKAITFPFDGFSNKNISVHKKTLGNIARSIMSGMLDYQWLQTQNKDVKNRVNTVLKNREIGWGIFDDEWKIITPLNLKVREIFIEIDEIFYNEELLNLYKLYKKYTSIPYGLNDYSFSLLLSIYITNKGFEAKLKVNGNIIKMQCGLVSTLMIIKLI